MHWIAPPEKIALADTLERRLWDSADQFRAESGSTLGIPFLGYYRLTEIAT
jgi:hypothetical protein